MEEEMRRVAILLGTVGVMALGLAATPAPAQAHDGWWGHPSWREQAWRRHEWRAHHYWHPRYYNQGYYNQGYYHQGFDAPRRHHGSRIILGFGLR
jgi:hypothetical protein